MISRRLFLLPGLSLCVPLAGCIVAGARFGVGHPERREAIHRRRHARSGPVHLRRLHRDSVVGSAGRAGRHRETRRQHGRRGGHRGSERQDGRSRVRRGEDVLAAHAGTGSVGGSARLVVSVPESANVRATSGDGAISARPRERHDRAAFGRRPHPGAANSSGNISASTGDGGDRPRPRGRRRRSHHRRRPRQGVRQADRACARGRATAASPSRREPGSAAEADWDISSGDGSVTLQIPDDFSADLDAHTGDGGIHLDGVSVTSHRVTVTRNTVRGRLGSGGRPVRVRTGDGSITLRRLVVAEAVGRPSGLAPLVNARCAYSVGSATPASTNASCRSRHLLHVPQCRGSVGPAMPITGLMHDSVSSNGTPERRAASNDLGLARSRAYGASTCKIVRQPQRQRARHRQPEFRRRVGKRIVPERAEHECDRCRPRRSTRRPSTAGRCCGPAGTRLRRACGTPAACR